MQSSNGGGGGGSDSQQQTQKSQPPPPPPQAAGQQQWVAMQYPPAAAAMLMQHHMMAPSPTHGHYPVAPHYMPYHPQQLHHQPPHAAAQQGSGGGGGGGENKTIWVGDLHNWMDEDYLRSCFASTGEVTSIKVIRNKQTGFSEGYGFVEFFSHAAAEKVLQTYPCVAMPNTDQPFRLNWATFSTGEKRSSNASDLSVFVGDLAADVTDALLHETFAGKYASVKTAKVVVDTNTGRSRGYGFVRFGDEGERTRAMAEMNGTYCSSRPMRIAAATPRKSSGYQVGYISNGGSQSDGDYNNTTIFVGGLDPSVSDEDLKQAFSEYGETASVKIPVGKGCGFVQFVNRNDAEEALQKLNGTTMGKQTVRLSWGRNPANKQSRNDFGNRWSGAGAGASPYYGGQMYNGYGYGMPSPHHSGMYVASSYETYPFYGSHQQQVS